MCFVTSSTDHGKYITHRVLVLLVSIPDYSGSKQSQKIAVHACIIGHGLKNASPLSVIVPIIHTMFKPAAPRLLRYSIPAIRAVRPQRTLFSSAPPSHRSRSWKNLAIRLGISAGGVYYYSTSNAFAEEPAGIFNCS